VKTAYSRRGIVPFNKQPPHREGYVPVAIGRRELIAALGSAAGWPLVARAQSERVRRIGVLMNVAAADPEGQAQVAAFLQALQQLGWSEDRNVRIDTRWGENDVERDRRYATELLAFAPDVILASGTLSVAALRRVTRTSPIVFAGVSDPVGAGLVDTLARPGGNVTGFMIFEYSLSGKWLELLKEVAPRLMRAAVLRDSANPAGIAQFGAVQAVAQSLGVELRPVDTSDAGEIERAIASFARAANGGLIVTPSASCVVVPRLWRYPQKNRAGRCQGLILAPLTRQGLLPKPAS
jgi:putative tryptophan/tyrosine transport system substrate-binding protein